MFSLNYRRSLNQFFSSKIQKQKIFSRDLFADAISVHNRNMKHPHAIEFDKTNLLAML